MAVPVLFSAKSLMLGTLEELNNCLLTDCMLIVRVCIGDGSCCLAQVRMRRVLHSQQKVESRGLLEGREKGFILPTGWIAKLGIRRRDYSGQREIVSSFWGFIICKVLKKPKRQWGGRIRNSGI